MVAFTISCLFIADNLLIEIKVLSEKEVRAACCASRENSWLSILYFICSIAGIFAIDIFPDLGDGSNQELGDDLEDTRGDGYRSTGMQCTCTNSPTHNPITFSDHTKPCAQQNCMCAGAYLCREELC